MLEPPNLSEPELIAALRAHYGLAVADLAFTPVGNDATAWAYRIVTPKGTRFFLKVKRGVPPQALVAVPRFLREQDIRQAVAPIPTQTDNLWAILGDFSLILYPFVDGRPGMDVGLSDVQWMELGRVLAQIHACPLPGDLLNVLPKESFTPKWLDTVERVRTAALHGKHTDPYAVALASFWQERQEEIDAIVQRAVELGCRVKNLDIPYVLCHADIHTANVLLDGHGGLFIVDWDETLLAPRERDLMFLLGGAVAGVHATTRQEQLFLAGYGAVDLDPLVLAYYRYEWVVQEFGDFGARVFFTEEMGEATRADAVRGFRQLFDPGDVVEAAYRAGRRIAL